MSQPQLFLGGTPIGAVSEMTTRDLPDPIVRFSQTTHLYNRRYRITTIWTLAGSPFGCSIFPSEAATYIYDQDETGKETLEYVVPYGYQVTVGGLDEAHHAVVEQVKCARQAS